MSTINGVDYSWARPGGAAIKAAGFDFAVRYIDYPGANGKGLTPDEMADLHGNGVAVCLVFESTAERALGGFTAGRVDAEMMRGALTVLGWPNDRPVYFAVDFDAWPSHQHAIDKYLRGAASILGAERIGVYGGYWVIKRCDENGSAAWFWQTYAWSGGDVHPRNHIYQYRNGQTLNGGEVDYNYAYGSDYGQWLPATAKPEPAPVSWDTVLRQAMADRLALMRLATEPDHLMVGRAVAQLRASGYPL